MARAISLFGGMSVLVDELDYKPLVMFRWHVLRGGGGLLYAARWIAARGVAAELEAAHAYDDAARLRYGAFARLNFAIFPGEFDTPGQSGGSRHSNL